MKQLLHFSKQFRLCLVHYTCDSSCIDEKPDLLGLLYTQRNGVFRFTKLRRTNLGDRLSPIGQISLQFEQVFRPGRSIFHVDTTIISYSVSCVDIA